MLKHGEILKRGCLLICAIVLSLTFFNCKATTNNTNNNDKKTTVTPPAKPDKPARVITGEINDEKALTLLYGKYDAKWKQAEWTADKAKLKAVEFNGEGLEGPFYSSVLLSKSYQENNIDKHMVLVQSNPVGNGCHACAPLVGGAIFVKDGNNWRLDIEQRYIAVYGNNGEAPKGELIKIGAEKIGVILKDQDMHQGITNKDMILIGEVDKDIKQLNKYIDLGGDNEGDCEESLATCWKYSAKIDFTPGRNPEFYDLIISYSGTKNSYDDKGVVKADGVQTYQFSNGKYQLTK